MMEWSGVWYHLQSKGTLEVCECVCVCARVSKPPTFGSVGSDAVLGAFQQPQWKGGEASGGL